LYVVNTRRELTDAQIIGIVVADDAAMLAADFARRGVGLVKSSSPPRGPRRGLPR